MQINIVRTTVFHDAFGTDRVWLETDLVSPVPGLTKQPLTLSFHCAANEGEAYCNNVLKLTVDKVIKG